jgi:hypothetical protein
MFRTALQTGLLSLVFLAATSSLSAQVIIVTPSPEQIEAQNRKLLNDWVKLYLGRKATDDELTRMLIRINKGATPEAIQTSILASPEYWKAAGGNAQGFIRKLFKDVLGKDATPADLLKLTAQVNGNNREEFVALFLKQTR